jgi:hypothetical protein
MQLQVVHWVPQVYHAASATSNWFLKPAKNIIVNVSTGTGKTVAIDVQRQIHFRIMRLHPITIYCMAV